MRIYTVHERVPKDGAGDGGLVLVPEAFSWAAFFFTFFWALWHRLWLGALLILVLGLALGVAMDALALGGPTGLAILLGFHLLIGLEANDWRRRSLERRGHVLVGVVAAENEDLAEQRFHDHRSTEADRRLVEGLARAPAGTPSLLPSPEGVQRPAGQPA
jgi:hypothetical protein